MLVLNRGVDEKINIGDSIVVTILGIDGDRVKIGIQAPQDVKILRGEIYLAVKDQIKIQEDMAQNSKENEAFDALRKILVEEAVKEVSPEQAELQKVDDQVTL
jgi:carbon storage regulator